MKQLLPILALAVTLGACKAKINETDNMNRNMVLVDTTGLHQNNILTDVGDNKFVITPKPVEVEPVRTVATRKPVRKASANNNSSNTVYSSGTNKSTNAAYPQKDKGWSDAAKGAAIGGGAGAILGAVVSKNNRGLGAVIGGVVGAGGGYAIGRTQDKKSGRVERARQRKAAASY
ncbi:MAG: YMGG-like glycine zipper-containing protein [Flavitalea sp.]